MTDRELLEMAAKAYWGEEIDDVVSVEWGDMDNAILYTHADNQDHNGMDRAYCWNPLEEDGDCARLEATLSLNVSWYPTMVLVGTAISNPASQACAEYYDRHNGDKNAARRRASVLAAATIGRAA